MKQMKQLAVGLVCLSLLACDEAAPAGGEVKTLRSSRQLIEGGTVDRTDTQVVGLAINLGGGGGALCSGSLIAPNLVLTARHCVAELSSETVDCNTAVFGPVYPASSFNATTNVTVSFNGRGGYQGQEVFVPDTSDNVCGYDIALIVLAQNVPANIAEPITPRVDTTVVRGEGYTAVGYGTTADGTGSGTRRILENLSVQCSGRQCGFFGITTSEWVGSDGVCQGDSGGPAIDELGRVIGVASRGGAGCVSSVYSGVAPWGNWIREKAEYAAIDGGYAPALWVTEGITDPGFFDNDADGVLDAEDNCIGASNADQADRDADGVGDLCDPDFAADRAGFCDVCNACEADADCGEGGLCVNFGTGGWCTTNCADGVACPGDTSCFDIVFGGASRYLCLNPDAGAAGICNSAYVCVDPTTPEVPAPGDGSGAPSVGFTAVVTAKTQSGCAAGGSASGAAALGMLAGLMALRRRSLRAVR